MQSSTEVFLMKHCDGVNTVDKNAQMLSYPTSIRTSWSGNEKETHEPPKTVNKILYIIYFFFLEDPWFFVSLKGVHNISIELKTLPYILKQSRAW